MGFYDTPGYTRDVAISGGYAYLADGELGLRIIDVSNPGRPVEAGFYLTGGIATGVAVSGSRVFVAAYGYGVRVVDVSNPARPIGDMARLNLQKYASHVAVTSFNVYVAAFHGGLVTARVVDSQAGGSSWDPPSSKPPIMARGAAGELPADTLALNSATVATGNFIRDGKPFVEIGFRVAAPGS